MHLHEKGVFEKEQNCQLSVLLLCFKFLLLLFLKVYLFLLVLQEFHTVCFDHIHPPLNPSQTHPLSHHGSSFQNSVPLTPHCEFPWSFFCGFNFSSQWTCPNSCRGSTIAAIPVLLQA